jgi:hypothetical protein
MSPARILLAAILLALAGCSSAYYGALEKLGIPKREVLVDRVLKARESQQEAKAQFAGALEQFLAVTKAPATELKATHDRLNGELKRSEERAAAVRDRIKAVDDVARALFEEWRTELAQYSNAALRRQSEAKYDATHRRYEELVEVMQRAAARMDPVLATFRDQVLFLKHNLNAQAIAALDTTKSDLEKEITRLVADMEKSIAEADAFIAAMKAEG